jgi:hypothetical protein
MFATLKLVLPYLRIAAVVMIFSGIIYFTCLALSRLSESKNKNYLKWDAMARIPIFVSFIGAVFVVISTAVYAI